MAELLKRSDFVRPPVWIDLPRTIVVPLAWTVCEGNVREGSGRWDSNPRAPGSLEPRALGQQRGQVCDMSQDDAPQIIGLDGYNRQWLL